MKKIFIYIPILLTILISCDKEKFNSDNAQPEYPMANIATLREAPYKIGAAVNVNSLKNNANYRQTVIHEMSSITAENAMKMNNISVSRGVYNWTDADYIVDFAQENNIRMHGHTLIWYKHTPTWVADFEGTKEDWKAIMKEYIQAVVGRYKGRVASWDVVNEIIQDDGTLRPCVWLTNIGKEYIDLAFQYAHEADPDALLFYNEYGHEYSHNRRLKVNHLVDSLKLNNVPIHGIGLQMHTNIGRSGNDLRYAIMAAGVLGLKVHVSELDVLVNTTNNANATFTDELALSQKETYRVVAKAMKDLPQDQQFGITTWGVHDPSSWLSANPDWALLFDDNYSKKPAYDGILQGIY